MNKVILRRQSKKSDWFDVFLVHDRQVNRRISLANPVVVYTQLRRQQPTFTATLLELAQLRDSLSEAIDGIAKAEQNDLLPQVR